MYIYIYVFIHVNIYIYIYIYIYWCVCVCMCVCDCVCVCVCKSLLIQSAALTIQFNPNLVTKVPQREQNDRSTFEIKLYNYKN